tara:strand:- start:15537 stop:15740 length:204 start_codon:yes stop_codon:yes gene_type:complete
LNKIADEALRNNVFMSPRDIFALYLKSHYLLPEDCAIEATDFAIQLFELDTNGRLPIDWEMWYRNQA